MRTQKIETIPWRQFMRKEGESNVKGAAPLYKVVRLSATLFAIIVPKTALAATADATFGNVLGAIMNIVDWIVVGVFIFAGVSWMFGHRGKALEMLIGGAAGYTLARHAVDIRDFLKTL